jgi:phosphoenolpyruvate synthase/pyruvate phosphate dikinase
VNLSVPQLADQAAALPAEGVGLMRAEFLALQSGTHPLALLEEGGERAYLSFFAEGLEHVARAFHPRPVTFRACDLKSNEYRGLAGGERFEHEEANPMLGRRGVFRYLEQPDDFRLQVRAVAEVRERGLDNVRLMLPFVRTVAELREVRELVYDVVGRDSGLELWAMAEVPATAFCAADFSAEVDGLSIGSNDLTQLVLGVDRDSPELQERYRAGDPAVVAAMRMIVEGAHSVGRPVGICGDQPSEDRALVRTLVELGIDSISVVPQALEETRALLDELSPEKVG